MSIKAMKQALEALEGVATWVEVRPKTHPWDTWQRVEPAITAIREALAEQPAQQIVDLDALGIPHGQPFQPAHGAAVNISSERVEKQAQKVHEQPAHHAVDWEKLYLLEVKKKNALVAKYERDTGTQLTRIIPMAEQPAQQEPVEEFAYKAITKRGEHCHFGTHAAARIWAGEGGEVETIKLRHLELVEQPAQPSKPWVGLTDEEIKRMAAPWFLSMYWKLCVSFGRAIEAKLREKNGGKA